MTDQPKSLPPFPARTRVAPMWKQPQEGEVSRPLVRVFGAGIAGLTAAHELVERGFQVQVFEPERQYYGSLRQRRLDLEAQHPRHALWAIGEGSVPASVQKPSDSPRSPPRVGGMAASQVAILPSPNGQLQLTLNPDEALRQAVPAGLEALLSGSSTSEPEHSRDVELPEDAALATIVSAIIAKDKYISGLEPRAQEAAWIEVSGPMSLARPIRELLENQQLAEPVKRALEEFRPRYPFAHRGSRGVTVRIAWRSAAGEHGYRFFPGYYRNLFDTMKRTPILAPRMRGERSAVRFELDSQTETAFDMLRPVPEMHMATGRGRLPLHVPRRPPTSAQEVLDLMKAGLAATGVALDDIVRYQYFLLKFWTACGDRREIWSTPTAESDGTWWSFVRGDTYGAEFQRLLRASSQAVVAMSEKEIDARTYGDAATQLLLDQLGRGPHVDMMLRGPTSDLWLDPWRDYLMSQGVRFHAETLSGIRQDGTPVFLGDSEAGERKKAWESEIQRDEKPVAHILAIPMHKAMALIQKLNLDGEGFSSPFKRTQAWQKHINRDPESFDQLVVDHEQPDAKFPFRSIAGIQYFFEDHLHLGEGHHYLPNSAWQIAGIAHSQLWADSRLNVRGVFSIDVGAFRAPDSDSMTVTSVSKLQLAERVWRQFIEAESPSLEIPVPFAAHVDASLEYDGDKLHRNRNPYLINLPGQWGLRPSPDAKSFGNWVMAGVGVATSTRMNTMEAANESGRRAANTVREITAADPRYSAFTSSPVKVWDLEDHELDDLTFFKRLDEELLKLNAGHLFEILGLDRLAAAPSGPGLASAFDAALKRHLAGVGGPLRALSLASADRLGNALGALIQTLSGPKR